MKKKFIAGVVLASLALWSAPAAFASAKLPSRLSAENSKRQAASTHDHSCCPGAHSRFVPPLFVMPAPGAMPCGEQHPCCAQQAPHTSPALPAASTTMRPGSGGVPVTIADQNRDSRNRTIAEAGSNPFQSYSVRSTILRI